MKKESNVLKAVSLLLAALLILAAFPAVAFALANPPSMTASFQDNGNVMVKTNNSEYAQKITNVKIDGNALPGPFDEICLVSNGNLYIDAYCFQQKKEYTITIIATGYNNATVTVSNAPLSPPSMTASFQDNGSLIVKTNNSAYAQKITNVKIDGNALPDSFDELCQVSNGNLIIDAYCFQQKKEYTVTIIAAGYNNATVNVSNVPLTPPSMTASFQDDGSVLVKAKEVYAKKIKDVKIDGNALPDSFDELCQVSNGNLIIDAYCFQQVKEYSITIIAAGYENATVAVSNVPLSPPSMTASFEADGSVAVKTNDIEYVQRITDVKIDGYDLPDSFDELCMVKDENLIIDAYCFQQVKEYTITVIAAGYEDAVVTVSLLSSIATEIPDESTAPTDTSDEGSIIPGSETSANDIVQPGEDSTLVGPAQQESGTLPFFVWIIIGALAAGAVATGVILILKKKKA